MAKTRFTYGSRSLAAAGATVLLAQVSHPWVQVLIREGQTAAWLLVLLSATLAALCLWPVGAALRRIPHGSLADVVNAAIGRWGTVLYALLLFGGAGFSAAMILREASEMALSAVFPHTPQTFATLSLMLSALWIAWGDSSSVVRVARILLPAIAAVILLILFGSLGWGEWRYLAPFWGPGPGVLLLRSVPLTKVFGHMGITAILAGQVTDRQNLVRAFVLTPLAGALLVSFTKMTLAMTFPYPVGTQINMPLHMAARLLVGGRFFERVEGLFLFFWVMGTSIMLGMIMRATAMFYAEAFGMPNPRTVVLPMAALILTGAFFTPDQATTVELHITVAPAYALITVFLPSLFALAALFRLRGRRA